MILVLSPCCAACARTLDRPSLGPVCEACWSSIRPCVPPLCRTCGDPLASWRIVSILLEQCARCRRAQPAIESGRAAGEYEGALRSIIHAFKYEGRRTLSTGLGALMRQAGAELLAGAHCVVPVPLHPWRRLVRGFNQADDLARTLGLPVVGALCRTRPTRPQTGLTAAARQRNIRGAFGLSPLVTGRRLERTLVDRIVVLVDDVRTTGATLEGCARVLRNAGVREVRGLTAARAAPPADVTR